jgi:hypothetical protein
MGHPYRPEASPALCELMEAEREEAPFGGFAGEIATPAPEPAAPPLLRP